MSFFIRIVFIGFAFLILNVSAARAVELIAGKSPIQVDAQQSVTCATEADLTKYNHGIVSGSFSTLQVNATTLTIGISLNKQFCQKTPTGFAFTNTDPFAIYSYYYIQPNEIFVEPLQYRVSVYLADSYKILDATVWTVDNAQNEILFSMDIANVLSAKQIQKVHSGIKQEVKLGFYVNQLSIFTNSEDQSTLQSTSKFHLNSSLFFF
jgi:hypothetical protein